MSFQGSARNCSARKSTSNRMRLGVVAVCGASQWMSALDINPLLYVDGEFVAVDALAILRPTE